MLKVVSRVMQIAVLQLFCHSWAFKKLRQQKVVTGTELLVVGFGYNTWCHWWLFFASRKVPISYHYFLTKHACGWRNYWDSIACLHFQFYVSMQYAVIFGSPLIAFNYNYGFLLSFKLKLLYIFLSMMFLIFMPYSDCSS